jgi:hypothetical protein
MSVFCAVRTGTFKLKRVLLSMRRRMSMVSSVGRQIFRVNLDIKGHALLQPVDRRPLTGLGPICMRFVVEKEAMKQVCLNP